MTQTGVGEPEHRKLVRQWQTLVLKMGKGFRRVPLPEGSRCPRCGKPYRNAVEWRDGNVYGYTCAGVLELRQQIQNGHAGSYGGIPLVLANQWRLETMDLRVSVVDPSGVLSPSVSPFVSLATAIKAATTATENFTKAVTEIPQEKIDRGDIDDRVDDLV